jgi:transposase
MARTPTLITLSGDEREQLEAMLRRPKAEAHYVERARIVLWAAEGIANKEIARRLATRAARVSTWRTRFEREGLAGLHDAPRMGRPPREQAGPTLRARLLAQLEQAPPAGYARWNGPLLARALGEPHANRICIQALERAQGWLRLPNGRALTGFSHEYRRHGTTTLFAALETATGRVHGGHYKRKRRDEFLDFLDHLVAQHPRKELHLVLDNLSTHQMPPEHPWRRRHPQVVFHFTPTHASWLNQIEVWFSILSTQALRGASFRSVRELIAAIDAFIASYNQTATPFAWTKVKVSAKTLNGKYANLIK